MSESKESRRFPSYRRRVTALVPVFLVLMAGLVHALEASRPMRGTTATSQCDICIPFSIDADVMVVESEHGDRLALAGFDAGGSPGDPLLPSRRLRFLLPADVDYATVKVALNDASWEDIPGTFDIAPAPAAATAGGGTMRVMWGDNDPANIVKGRDMAVYGADAVFPASALGEIVPSKYRQWNIGSVSLCPTAYNPVRKTLRMLRSGTVCITFDTLAGAGADVSAAAGGDAFWNMIAADLENPGDRDASYLPSASSSSGGGSPSNHYDFTYVIITTSTIVSGSTTLSAFTSHKADPAWESIVKVVTEAAAMDSNHYVEGTNCETRADNIRHWLQTYYLTDNVRYVLLIGDPDPTLEYPAFSDRSIPMKLCYAESTRDPIPTDMFYAELSGSWDRDTDGYPGEWGDDFGAGGIDRDCEAAVGRIPVYTTAVYTDLDSIVQKMMDYENATGDLSWREKLLIPGAIHKFKPEDNDGDGAEDADDPEVHGDNWGEALKAFAEDEDIVYSPYTLYEKEGVYPEATHPDLCYPTTPADAPLLQANIQAEWLNNYGFVTWFAHGGETYATRLVWANDNYINDVICQRENGEVEVYDPDDLITPHPEKRLWRASDCAALDDTHPSWVVQASCRNAWPENSGNLAYSLLKQGAIGTFASTRDVWYAVVDPWTIALGKSLGGSASYGYYIVERMITSNDPAGDALNYCKSDFGVDMHWATWENMLGFNLYGDPSSSQERSRPNSRTCQFFQMVPNFADTTAPELAQLGINYGNNRVMADVKDASSGNLIKKVFFTLNFEPISLVVLPHFFTGTSAPELACLGRRWSDGANLADVRDASSDDLIRRVWYHAEFIPLDIEYVPDFGGGTAAPELVVLARRASDGAIMGSVRDASSRNLLGPRTWFHPDFMPVDIEVMDDIDANGVTELVSLARRGSDGAVASEVKDPSTQLLINRVYFDTSYWPVDLEVVPDFGLGTSAPELVVLGRRGDNGAVTGEVRDASTGNLIVAASFDSTYTPVDLEVVPDFGLGTSAPELVVLGRRAIDDMVTGEMRDASTGEFINTVSFTSEYRPKGIEVLSSFGETTAPELASHGGNPNTGSVIGQVKDASSGALLQNVYFSSYFVIP